MKSFLKGESPQAIAKTAAPILPVHVVDPSLFTLPYDLALVAALRRAGLAAALVGRPLRPGELTPDVPFHPLCFRRLDGAPRRFGALGSALKAVEHLGNWLALDRLGSGVLHLQWLPFPLADAVALRLRRRRGPVVVTVHDTTPFNGAPSHPLQARGFRVALGAADRLIVHTAEGRRRLVDRGLPAERIAVVPHGPLDGAGPCSRPAPGARFVVVAFGKMRPYKGLDLLVDALARLDAPARAGLRVILAGEPLIDLAPLRFRIAAAGLAGTVEIVPRRLDAAETRALLGAADAFVFPYREIEASGVLYLVQGLGRWLIASRLGAFAEAIEDGRSGRLVPPGDPEALAAALREAATLRPRPLAAPRVTGWDEIAAATAAVYAAAGRARAAGAPGDGEGALAPAAR